MVGISWRADTTDTAIHFIAVYQHCCEGERVAIARLTTARQPTIILLGQHFQTRNVYSLRAKGDCVSAPDPFCCQRWVVVAPRMLSSTQTSETILTIIMTKAVKTLIIAKVKTIY